MSAEFVRTASNSLVEGITATWHHRRLPPPPRSDYTDADVAFPRRSPPQPADRASMTPGAGRSLAERVAAEVFVSLVQQGGVRPCEVAAFCRSVLIERDQSRGSASRYEIVRHFEPAPAFWPLTVDNDDGSGYGIDGQAACIRYEQRPFPADGYVFGFIGERAEFGPGCRELVRRATASDRLFVCETVPPGHAVHVARTYLIDAALSLIEGGGPVIVDGSDRSARSARPDRQKRGLGSDRN